MPQPRPFTAAVLALALAGLAAGPAAAQEAPGPHLPLLPPLSDGAEVPLPPLAEGVPTPQEHLGYPVGGRFTHHHRILAYFETLAAASERVTMWGYGETYEGRPLTLVAVSSAENVARLEEIRRRHLRMAAPAALSPAEGEALAFTQPVVVWLSYGIHGDEPSSAEAAMAAAYVLAAAGGEWERRLREVVVLIDPLANPDGRERYVGAYEQRRGREPDPEPGSIEHREPWPGGRTNHYWVDLNRDWTWASQAETRHRLAAYRRWEPQVLVDFHEMRSGSTYFFPPPAEPVHPAVDGRVLDWLETFGRGNAEAFDRQGWLFFKSQSYDLFYPGYADSYAALRGAVGMTYEVGGGARAGQVLELPDGRVLTLADRIARHLLATLSTVTTAAAHRAELLAAFTGVRRAASTHLPQSFLWEADQPEAGALAELLGLHGIAVHRLAAPAELVARPGRGGPEERRRFPAGTYAVTTAQPLAGLVEALLRVESPLPEAYIERQRRRLEAGEALGFYDITAWSLPVAFNLDTWSIYGQPTAVAPAAPAASGVTGEGGVGYLAPPQGLISYRLAAGLRRQGILHRFALAPFTLDGESFPRGTLFIPRRGNPEGLEERLAALAEGSGPRLRRVATSFTDSGISLGSDDMVPVRPARVGLACGEGVDPEAAGELWHLLDWEVDLPHSRIELAELPDRLAELDAVVLPPGSGYGERLGDGGAEAVGQWVERGGVLVAIGETLAWLRASGLVAFESWEAEGAPLSGEGRGEAGAREMPGLYTPGAALATDMHPRHPATAGLPDPPAALFRGSRVLLPEPAGGSTVLTAAADRPVVTGFAWPEAEERLAGALLVADVRLGEGRVVAFAQDPAFRLFWRGTMPLLLNAILYGPSWPR